MEDFIYHYTNGQHLDKIIESGLLRVSEWERKNKVKPPALWLSLNPVWEPTASKSIDSFGTAVKLSKEQQHEMLGLYRFVIPFNKTELCSWGRYKYKSNTSSSTYLDMQSYGRSLNANPKDWYASFKNIPLTKCIRCEKWDGEKWEEYDWSESNSN